LTESAANKSMVSAEIIAQVKVYPNPFTNNIVVTLEKNDLNSSFELFDISGRKIMTSKLNNSVNRIQFNKPGAGIYIYRITNNKGKVFATGKLIKK
jgi:Secretion system C-terminal sorting domain